MPGAEPYAPGMAGDAVIGAGVRGNKALHFLQGRAARPHFLPGEGKIAKTLAKSRHYFSLGGRQRDAVRYLGRHRLWGQGEARNSKDGARRSAAALAEPARRAPPSARGQADLFTAEHPRSARADGGEGEATKYRKFYLPGRFGNFLEFFCIDFKTFGGAKKQALGAAKRQGSLR